MNNIVEYFMSRNQICLWINDERVNTAASSLKFDKREEAFLFSIAQTLPFLCKINVLLPKLL